MCIIGLSSLQMLVETVASNAIVVTEPANFAVRHGAFLDMVSIDASIAFARFPHLVDLSA